MLGQAVGIKSDLRVFYCRPEFKQIYEYACFGIQWVPEGNHVTQKGTHLDLSANIGVFLRI